MKAIIQLLLLFSLTINFTLLDESFPYRNVMYYGDWSIYTGQKNFYPSNIDIKSISHLTFAFLDMDSNGDLVLVDEYADFKTVFLPELKDVKFGAPYAGVLGEIAILKVKYPHLRVGISVGGPERSGYFSEIAKDKVKRRNFVVNIVKFMDYLGYDFIDIYWDHPTIIRKSYTNEKGEIINEVNSGSPEDTENFTLLLEEIRNELNRIGNPIGKYFELSVALSVSPELMSKIEYDRILDIVDFANLMTFDLNGGWNSYTGHQTPLYTNEAYINDTMLDAKNSVDICIKYLEETYGNLIDMEKILIGVAPYTRAWSGVKDDGLDKNNPGLYASAIPNSVKSADGTESGIYGFEDIPSLIKEYDLIQYFDNKAKAAYYYSPTTGYFFSCDNEESVAAKGKYVKEKGLGGLVGWMASYDGDNTITKAMFNSLYEDGYSFPEQDMTKKYSLISISAKITETETGYEIGIQNNAVLVETNPALKNAEVFRKNIYNMIVYIKSKSGAVFFAGPKSGTVTNKDGLARVDPSSNEGAQIIPTRWQSYYFKVHVSGIPDKNDIYSISVSQRILPNLDEFKERVVYYNP